MSNLEPHGGENFKNKIIQILKTKAEHEESILGPDSLELPWQPWMIYPEMKNFFYILCKPLLFLFSIYQ